MSDLKNTTMLVAFARRSITEGTFHLFTCNSESNFIFAKLFSSMLDQTPHIRPLETLGQ